MISKLGTSRPGGPWTDWGEGQEAGCRDKNDFESTDVGRCIDRHGGLDSVGAALWSSVQTARISNSGTRREANKPRFFVQDVGICV